MWSKMGKEREKRTIHWNVPAPKPLNDALVTFITSNFHMTKAEFIREAVREKLAKHGIVHVSKKGDSEP